MDILIIVLTLLTAVVLSSAIARAAARMATLPLPFVQIGLGVLIGLVFKWQISIPPELFLLLFIAPLLFLDGWRMPKEALLKDKWMIFSLAIGLVLFTVLVAGVFIHWLIPAVPLAVAFALAAVLSPTDSVAVSAIAKRTPVPRRLMHVLEGEALLNDASGLVCMRFAVAAALTGGFSIVTASTTFLWLAGGGLAIGAAVALIANTLKDWIARHFGEETGSQILISLLIPFAAYLLADRAGTSGILASVAAGIAMNHEERTGHATAVTRIRRAAVWEAVRFAANGVIFVLLGQQLSPIITGAENALSETQYRSGLWLLVYVLAICLVLAVLRAAWVGLTTRIFLSRAPHDDRSIWNSGWRLTATASLAGVRGAVALSGVMSLPVSLSNGAPFPARNLVIFLAAGAIVGSLVIANLGLPWLSNGLTAPADQAPDRDQENAARLAAAQAAIKAVEGRLSEVPKADPDAELQMRGGRRVIAQYQRYIEARSKATTDPVAANLVDETERDMRIVALTAERDEYFSSARSGRLADQVARILIREVDLTEARLMLS